MDKEEEIKRLKEHIRNDIECITSKTAYIIENLQRDVMEKHIHSPTGFPFVDAESVFTAIEELKELKDYAEDMKKYYGGE